MRNQATRFAVGQTSTDRLHHVQMVLNVVETAIIRQAVEECPNGFFGSHGNLNQGVTIRVYAVTFQFLAARVIETSG